MTALGSLSFRLTRNAKLAQKGGNLNKTPEVPCSIFIEGKILLLEIFVFTKEKSDGNIAILSSS